MAKTVAQAYESVQKGTHSSFMYDAMDACVRYAYYTVRREIGSIALVPENCGLAVRMNYM